MADVSIGELPDLDPVWGQRQPDSSDRDTSASHRELLRHAFDIPASPSMLLRLTLAMNACADVSKAAVASVIADLHRYELLLGKFTRHKQEALDRGDPVLPLVKADVIEYSDASLRDGETQSSLCTKPLEEEMDRLKTSICWALNFPDYALPGPCCSSGFTSAIPLTRS